MSPDLKPGIAFEWTYTVPERSTVPRLYHDTPFCLDKIAAAKKELASV